ncbi:uncharacterized protein TNCT_347811 [Trichonephila clavata]|uniref:Uncharacterized protein n=1 Tax=Trichonephila clavata TaxID=2740835 RepID=A0A8X6I406_TRICU|nr:uncharacterized protein TNCT_347811 [Trichonephila clavata]
MNNRFKCWKWFSKFAERYEIVNITFVLNSLLELTDILESALKCAKPAEAAQAIEGFEINELNYDSAVELKKRFGNKEVIINNHMNKLLNLLLVYKSKDIPKLKKLYSEIEVNVRSLSALGLEPKSYRSMLIAVVLKIIPTEFTLEYNRRNVDKKLSPDINDFLEFFQAEIESRERTYSMKPEFDTTSLYTNSKKNKFKFVPPPELDNIPQTLHLENFVLANSPDCQEPITILIGADYYATM